MCSDEGKASSEGLLIPARRILFNLNIYTNLLIRFDI